MTTSKKSNLSFFLFIAFVSVVLSLWIVYGMSIKNEQTDVLQNQIDSLVYITNILHQGDSSIINIESYLPQQKVNETDGSNLNVVFRIIVFLIIGGFIFIYIRYKKIKRGCCRTNPKKE